jgi:hypothetical protein
MKNQHFVIKNADFVYKKEKSRKNIYFFRKRTRLCNILKINEYPPPTDLLLRIGGWM